MTASTLRNAGAPAPIWQKLRFDARQAAEQEPSLSSYLAATVLNHENFSEALCYQLAQKAGGQDMSALAIREICEEAYTREPAIVAAATASLQQAFAAASFRRRQRTRGMAATVVNGQVLLRNGNPTGALPGRLVRGTARCEA